MKLLYQPLRIFVRELMSIIGLLREDSEDMIDESRGERHPTFPFYGLPDGEKDNAINISAVFRNGNFWYFIGGQKYCYNEIQEVFSRKDHHFNYIFCKPKRISFCNFTTKSTDSITLSTLESTLSITSSSLKLTNSYGLTQSFVIFLVIFISI